MGNAAMCVRPGHHTGRVMRPDGSIEEFEYPIQVATLASLYPGFLVVHCSTADLSFRGKSKITVMDVKDRLIPGQAYILYQIPAQYKSLYAQYARRLPPPPQRSQRRRRKNTPPMKVIVQCLTQFVRTHDRTATPPSARAPLLHSGGKGEEIADLASKRNEQILRRKLVLSMEPYLWRPTLDCIPESPSCSPAQFAACEFQRSESLGISPTCAPPAIPVRMTVELQRCADVKLSFAGQSLLDDIPCQLEETPDADRKPLLTE